MNKDVSEHNHKTATFKHCIVVGFFIRNGYPNEQFHFQKQ